MPDVLEKCPVCHALLDEEDLFCANCGTESPYGVERKNPAAGSALSTHNFECAGCGASMSYDASAQTLRCPFCGSEKLTAQRDTKVLAAQKVVPFAIEQPEALAILHKWMGSSFWRPSDLVQRAIVEKLTPVYVPYWVFSAKTFTYWTADSSQTPAGARASWFPLSGQHHGEYRGVLIGASGALTPAETGAICPFDLGAGVAPQKIDLDNAVVEQFRVQRKYARPLAQQGLENLESQACCQYVPGRCRNMHANVRVEDLAAEPVLLPVWIMAYRYRDQVYRFVANGQTGHCAGTAPRSWQKIAVAVGAILLAIVVALTCTGIVGGILSGRS
jgi:hypothetical protein